MEQPQLQRPATERPSYKLTMELLSTYKLINELFYEAKRKRQAMEKAGDKKAIFNDGYDDDSGNYIVQIGEEIAGRYIVEEVLGAQKIQWACYNGMFCLRKRQLWNRCEGS